MAAEQLIGAGLGAVSSIIGGMGAPAKAKQAKAAFDEKAKQGIDTLNAGKAASNAAFNPYTTAGSTGAAPELDAIQGRQQAPTAVYDQVTAKGAEEYLDPSAQYQMAQANKATQASALAKGGMGGGLAKALSNNSAKMAQTYWTQAQQNQLAAKNQNFNQQDVNYQRNNQFQQDNITNLGNVAQRGLAATGTNQGIQAQYNKDINGNYVDMGNAGYSSKTQQGSLFGDTANNVGKGLGAAASSIDFSKLFGG